MVVDLAATLPKTTLNFSSVIGTHLPMLSSTNYHHGDPSSRKQFADHRFRSIQLRTLCSHRNFSVSLVVWNDELNHHRDFVNHQKADQFPHETDLVHCTAENFILRLKFPYRRRFKNFRCHQKNPPLHSDHHQWFVWLQFPPLDSISK